MPAFPISDEQMAAVQADLLRQADREQPPFANVDVTTTLHDDGELIYRGRRFRVPPIPYRQGVRLQALDLEWRTLGAHEPTPDVLAAIQHVVAAMLTLFAGLVARRWWQARAPFVDAELEEIRDLRDFFWQAQTRSRVVARDSVAAPHWLQPTPWNSSPVSRIGIRAGWRRTVTPVASPTINSDSEA